MAERDGRESFLEEYAYVTGKQLKLVAAGERPDFICERGTRRFGLEVVRAMRDPVQQSWDMALGRDGHLHGLDAAILVQEALYRKDRKRGSAGWTYQKWTSLVVQLIGSDGDEMSKYLDDELMDEMADTGVRSSRNSSGIIQNAYMNRRQILSRTLSGWRTRDGSISSDVERPNIAMEPAPPPRPGAPRLIRRRWADERDTSHDTRLADRDITVVMCRSWSSHDLK
jgi:hypothetical protein